jgi:hypothetical protein
MPDDPAPDPLTEPFERLLAAWDDPAEHKRFLALAATLDRLADAGKRYRGIRDGDPDKRATAEAQIDRLFGLAMEKLAATRTPPPPKQRPLLLWIALGLAAVLIFSAVYFALLRGV